MQIGKVMQSTIKKKTPSSPISNWSKKKYYGFAIFSTTLMLLVGLACIEWFLSYQLKQIAHSEKMQAGLIQFDNSLGWQLSPGWKGTHSHHDFNTLYTINRTGLRHFAELQPKSGQVAVLGDSFTFGLGVADNETFTAHMNKADPENYFINLGVPGYSTDQEYLLLKRFSQYNVLDSVLLVVYLSNDLFDNQLPFPMQADHAKPFFSLQAGQLIANKTPLTTASKAARARKSSLTDIVLGDTQLETTWLTQALGSLTIFRQLDLLQNPAQLSDQYFKERFSEAIVLFLALTDAIKELPTTSKQLNIALLPGISYITQPTSLSAQYQEYLRKILVQKLSDKTGINVIDLASTMRTDSNANNHQKWYFPNEGHLTPAGHEFVAKTLIQNLYLK